MGGSSLNTFNPARRSQGHHRYPIPIQHASTTRAKIMKAQIVEQVEFFSEAELESLEFSLEELDAIEEERVPNLESISFDEVAKALESSFEAKGLEWNRLAGRLGALAATRKYKQGTVGFVVHRAVGPLYKILGNFASGNIGKHYRESDAWLRVPDNDQNIEAFARRETDWWRQQPGLPGWLGRRLTAQGRLRLLKCVKDNLQNPDRCS